MADDEKLEAIWVKPITKQRFVGYGKYGDTADDILNRILDSCPNEPNRA